MQAEKKEKKKARNLLLPVPVEGGMSVYRSRVCVDAHARYNSGTKKPSEPCPRTCRRSLGNYLSSSYFCLDSRPCEGLRRHPGGERALLRERGHLFQQERFLRTHQNGEREREEKRQLSRLAESFGQASRGAGGSVIPPYLLLFPS